MIEELSGLVHDWLDLDEVARRLGVPVTKVRQLLRDRELVGVRPAGGGRPLVPAELVTADGPVKGLAGTLTLLHDAGYDDVEALRWLFTADESLPGTPLAALRANRGTEVRRRAQALGF